MEPLLGRQSRLILSGSMVARLSYKYYIIWDIIHKSCVEPASILSTVSPKSKAKGIELPASALAPNESEMIRAEQITAVKRLKILFIDTPYPI